MTRDTEPLRTQLRQQHGVRLVESHEEGSAAGELPRGVYGFTGSAALAAPLFAARRYRNFEVHHCHDGQIVIVGFVTPEEARRLNGETGPIDLMLYPDIDGDATEVVGIAYSRIAHHRQYTIHAAPGLALSVAPLPEPARA